jgi:hypothetical protein
VGVMTVYVIMHNVKDEHDERIYDKWWHLSYERRLLKTFKSLKQELKLSKIMWTTS